MRLLRLPVLFVVPALCASLAMAQGFRFSQPDNSAQQEEAAKQQRIIEQLSVPCKASIKDKKIMVVIGERQSNGWIVAEQQNYGPHFEAINQRLRGLGLRTYTPEEIRRQIAQAEIDAYFRNDPDAALAASRKVGANFVLKGLITAQVSGNPMMRVNQVSVDMGFTLTGSNGRQVATADANSSSYAGADIRRMALTLVNEQADEVVAKLYAEYCANAGIAAGGKAR